MSKGPYVDARVLKKIAEIKNLDLEETKHALVKNAFGVFGLP